MQLFLLAKGGILPWHVPFAAACAIFCRLQLCTAYEIFFYQMSLLVGFWITTYLISEHFLSTVPGCFSQNNFLLCQVGPFLWTKFQFCSRFSLVCCSPLLFPNCETIFQILRHSCAFKQSTTQWGKKKPKYNSLWFILNKSLLSVIDFYT